jgi:uncharacterized coiled-coil protein SlyX
MRKDRNNVLIFATEKPAQNFVLYAGNKEFVQIAEFKQTQPDRNPWNKALKREEEPEWPRFDDDEEMDQDNLDQPAVPSHDNDGLDQPAVHPHDLPSDSDDEFGSAAPAASSVPSKGNGGKGKDSAKGHSGKGGKDPNRWGRRDAVLNPNDDAAAKAFWAAPSNEVEELKGVVNGIQNSMKCTFDDLLTRIQSVGEEAEQRTVQMQGSLNTALAGIEVTLGSLGSQLTQNTAMMERMGAAMKQITERLDKMDKTSRPQDPATSSDAPAAKRVGVVTGTD